ncbi:MAG TPA: hypothetical protein VGI39_23795 [Polyangiaceae bacterium]
MAFLSFVLALTLFAAPPAAALVLWLWVRRLHEREGLPRFARWSAYTLVGVAGVISLGTVARLIESVLAVRAPGSSAAERQKILASGLAEAVYNGAFAALLVGIGALWVGFVRWRASRRA